MAKIGRPTMYTIDLAAEICDAIATTSKGLKKLCRENKHWPERQVIFRWLIKYTEFSDMYEKSKALQIQAMIDDVIDIADDTSSDVIIRIDKNGDEQEVCNTEYIARSRLRVDTRKWLASKLCPRLYGERKVNEVVSDDAKSLVERIIDKL